MKKQKIEENIIKLQDRIESLQLQLKELQIRKKDLEEQKYLAETAEAMKVIKKYKIPAERLQFLNMIQEDEILKLLEQKEREQKEQKADEKAISV